MQRDRSEVGTVFWVSAAFSLAFILWSVIAPESFATVTQVIFDWVVSNLGWFYLLAGNFFLVSVIILALSRYGRLRLGKEDERPEFSRFAWFAMLFQAGMGPALIFWGVAEPLMHYNDPPFGLARPGTTDAAQVAMQYSYFHWTLHPWAMYAVVGLAVGYFSFRRDEPGLISPVFRPLIGDRVDGPWGKTIDIMAVLAILFGVAVSLGSAGLQLTAGLGETFGTPTGVIVQLLVIGVTTVAFMLSASKAIDKGVNYLSHAPGADLRRDRPLLGVHGHGLAGPFERDQFHIRPSEAVRVRSRPRPRRERHQMARTRPRERYLCYCVEPGDVQ